MAKSKRSEFFVRLYKKRDGTKAYIAQVKVPGFNRVAKSFPTESAAIEWRKTLKAELEKQGRPGTAVSNLATITIADLVREYLEDPETKNLRSYSDRSTTVSWWANHYAAERVMDFSVLTIRAARNQLMHGRAAATVNRHLAGMRKAWNWGQNAGLVPRDHRWPLSLMLTEPKARSRFLTDDEIQRVLTASAKQGPTMHAAVLVSIACGLRKGELLRLKWPDVDFDHKSLRIHLTKNGQSRGVYLPASAANALRALKRSTVVDLGASVFITETGEPVEQGWIEYRWRAVKVEAKLKDFRWHDLRHSCASILAQNGASLIEIGSVLGHKSVSATSRYAHLVEASVVTGHAALDAKLAGAPQ